MLYQAIVICGLITLGAEAQRAGPDQAGVRFEFLFKSFSHSGKLSDGKDCDVGSPCDPSLRGYVDVVGPDGKYVGPQQDEKKGLGSNKGKSNGQGPQKKKEVNEWPVIWEGTDIKGTAQLNKVVTKDYCGKPVTRATVRAEIDDVDDKGRKDLMDTFSCMNFGYVAENLQKAEWSQLCECFARYNQENKLLFVHRSYNVPAKECGKY